MALGEKTGAAGKGANLRFTAVDLRQVMPFGVFFGVCLFAPRFTDDAYITTLIYIGINVLLVVGLNLLMGYAGQISLGHAAFFGIGAFTSAILTRKPMPGEVIPGFAVGVGVMLGAAVLIALTRVKGWRLAACVAAMLVAQWISNVLGWGVLGALPLYAAAMAGTGVLTRTGVVKPAVAGVAAALMAMLCNSFLLGVLANAGTGPWKAMAVGVFFTGLIAYLIGDEVLRLRGHYLAMATLGFGIIVEIVFRQWTAVTGGSSDGIFDIPSIEYARSLPAPIIGVLKWAAGGELGMKQEYYYLVWAFVFVALLVSVNIVRSRVGRAFRAVHGSEIAAESLGVDTERYKVQVFVFSAALASVAGSLHAHNAGIGYVHPSEFSFIVSVLLVVMVVVGGMASVWGSLFGAGVIQLIKDWLLGIDKAAPVVFGVALKGLDPIVFGAVLIIVMMLLPQGLVRGLTDAAKAAWARSMRARAQASE